jgi:hypothetical protein
MTYSSFRLPTLALCAALILPAGAMAQSTVGAGTPGQSQTGNDPANSGTHTTDPDVAPATNGTTGTGTNGGTHHHRHKAQPTTTNSDGTPAGSSMGDNPGSTGTGAPH